jgi:hypothetical protein
VSQQAMVDEDAEMRALFAAASFDASLEQLAPLFAAAFSDGAQPLLARDTSAAAGAASPALQLLAVALYAVHAIAQVRFTRASAGGDLALHARAMEVGVCRALAPSHTAVSGRSPSERSSAKPGKRCTHSRDSMSRYCASNWL